MAADTREPEGHPTDPPQQHDSFEPRRKPKYDTPKSQTAKLWEAFGNPEEPINVLPGANYNSAGGKPREATMADAFKTLSLSNLTTFYKTPCARDSLLVGMGAGFGIGGVRGILGGIRSLWPACNLAVASFAVASFVTHEFCQRRRVKELNGMKEAVELMRDLKVKKQQEREEAKKAKEEAARLEEERRRKSWFHVQNYKFW